MARQADKPTETENLSTTNHYRTFSHGRGWLYALIALVILVIVFAAGAAIGNFHRNGLRGGFYGKRGIGLVGPRRGMGGLGGGNRSTQNRVAGVVTSVNGNSFTVAGNGATTDVTTSSSTQYRDGDSVKQNDTVVVYGNLSNNTFNATQVVINP
ncbi:MAG: DUF5666 domain-containing protein [Candidatus Saccharimonadales bacterium]